MALEIELDMILEKIKKSNKRIDKLDINYNGRLSRLEVLFNLLNGFLFPNMPNVLQVKILNLIGDKKEDKPTNKGVFMDEDYLKSIEKPKDSEVDDLYHTKHPDIWNKDDIHWFYGKYKEQEKEIERLKRELLESEKYRKAFSQRITEAYNLSKEIEKILMRDVK